MIKLMKILKFLSKIIAIIVLGAVLVLLLGQLNTLLEEGDPAIAAAILGGIFAILAAIAAASLAYMRESTKSRAEAHRDKKVTAYKKFSTIIFEMFRQIKTDNGVENYLQSKKFKTLM